MSDQPTDLYSQRNEDNTQPGADVGDLATFTRLKQKAIVAWRARSKWRKEADRAYDFVANHQWSEEDITTLNEQHRPAVSFNRVAPLIKAVCGLEVNNRQTVAYLPRTQDDVEVDEAITGAAKWVRDECMAEDEESEAFRDMAICGEGWVETRMDYDCDPKGKIVEERTDPMEMCPDENASRQNYIDARMLFRIRTMSSEDAQDLFDTPFSSDQLNATWIDDEFSPTDGGAGNKKDYPAKTREAVSLQQGLRGKVRLVQVQWWEREPCYLVAEQGSDELKEMSVEEYTKYSERVNALRQADAAAMQSYSSSLTAYTEEASLLAGVGEQHPNQPPVQPQPQAPVFTSVQSKRKCFYEAFLGSQLLTKEKIEMGEFKFRAMTAERDKKQKMFYGMLRDMFDPQMWANKWLSQSMHIMNTNAKGGIMAETDAFQNVRKAETDWADNTKIIWTKPGAISGDKIKERVPPPLPQGLSDLMGFALSSLRDVTGVNLELLGQADREQAASLEAQRRQAAMTILASLFDSLRRFRKEQGRLLLHFIQLLPEGTLVRVLEQGQYKYVPLVKSKKVEDYDIIMDETPSSPDQKQATWALTLEMIRGGVPLSPPAIVTLLKYSPYPSSVVQEIKKSMGLDGGDVSPEAMKVKLDQAEQALQVLEKQLQEATAKADTAQGSLQNEQIQTQIDAAKLQIEQYKAETQRLGVEITGIGEQLNRQNEIILTRLEAALSPPVATQGEQ